MVYVVLGNENSLLSTEVFKNFRFYFHLDEAWKTTAKDMSYLAELGAYFDSFRKRSLWPANSTTH